MNLSRRTVLAVAQNKDWWDTLEKGRPPNDQELSEFEARIKSEMGPDEIFERALEWNGIVGFASEIHEMHEEIFG